jgi:hypothetical protein
MKNRSSRKSYPLISPTIPSLLPICHRSLRLLKIPLEEVGMFRVFTREFPYGNSDANSPPRRDRPKKLCLLRPDLPAWLEAVLERAVAVDSVKRFHDVMEFALEIEAGPPQAPPPVRRPQTLLERAPVQFWQGVAALLGMALILSLLRR